MGIVLIALAGRIKNSGSAASTPADKSLSGRKEPEPEPADVASFDVAEAKSKYMQLKGALSQDADDAEVLVPSRPLKTALICVGDSGEDSDDLRSAKCALKQSIDSNGDSILLPHDKLKQVLIAVAARIKKATSAAA